MNRHSEDHELWNNFSTVVCFVLNLHFEKERGVQHKAIAITSLKKKMYDGLEDNQTHFIAAQCKKPVQIYIKKTY